MKQWNRSTKVVKEREKTERIENEERIRKRKWENEEYREIIINEKKQKVIDKRKISKYQAEIKLYLMNEQND